MSILKIKNFTIGNQEPMTLMGGVNVLESESVVMSVAEKFAKTTSSLKINWIFKGSFDKANRSSISSFRGPGLDEGLKILEKVKSEFDAPIITDIHEPSQADPVSKICDVIQIPAFLCRQTDLVVAAAKTKKIIQSNKNIKFRKLILKKDVSKISVIGVGMITTPGVTFRMFQALANKKINIQVISTSEIKISVLIDKKNTKKALIALHKEFKLDS